MINGVVGGGVGVHPADDGSHRLLLVGSGDAERVDRPVMSHDGRGPAPMRSHSNGVDRTGWFDLAGMPGDRQVLWKTP